MAEVTLLSEFMQMPLFHPSRVFQRKKNARKLNKMKVFVKYVYLGANFAPTVFREGQHKDAINKPKAGLKAIQEEYDA